jgi:histone acetyltransferase (RNA polymerase elongator complex component)
MIEDTHITFTPDWAKICRVVESVPEELRGLRDDLKTSNLAQTASIKLAHDRMDGIQIELRALAGMQTRWGAFGAGVCAVILAIWALMKFVFNRG